MLLLRDTLRAKCFSSSKGHSYHTTSYLWMNFISIILCGYTSFYGYNEPTDSSVVLLKEHVHIMLPEYFVGFNKQFQDMGTTHIDFMLHYRVLCQTHTAYMNSLRTLWLKFEVGLYQFRNILSTFFTSQPSMIHTGLLGIHPHHMNKSCH